MLVTFRGSCRVYFSEKRPQKAAENSVLTFLACFNCLKLKLWSYTQIAPIVLCTTLRDIA